MKKRILFGVFFIFGIAVTLTALSKEELRRIEADYSMQRIGQCDICTEGGHNCDVSAQGCDLK